MANQILLKRSSTAAKVPQVADLALGELAINTRDGKLFLKKNDGSDTIVEIGAVISVAGRTGAVVLSTTDVTEGTRLYYTDARASAAAPVQSVAGRTGAVVLTKSDVGLANVENKSSATIRDELTSSNVTTALGFTPVDNAKLGVASGVATLDGSGKILSAQLPAITITDTFIVASQAAMLALTAETGDVAVRTDLSKSFILKGTNAATLADWQELLTPSDVVQSVAGRTGAVTLTTTDVAEGTRLYYTDARARASVSVSGVGLAYNSGTGAIASNATSANTANTLMSRDANGAFSAGTANLAGSLYTSGAVALNGATGSYSGYSSGLTLNYTGIGSQHGITLKPGTSTADTNAINFLSSESTYTTSVYMASIQHLANDAGMNLTGTWKVNGGIIASTSSNITGTAANVTGTVAIANGGTGATTAAQARTNLGVQAALGFTPIQQGGGTGQAGNKTYIGWAADASGLRVMVDTTDFGSNWPINSRNVTGMVAIANGGTAATTAEGAASNLGVSRINPTAAKAGDVRVVGSVISMYDGSAWKQVFPAVYA